MKPKVIFLVAAIALWFVSCASAPPAVEPVPPVAVAVPEPEPVEEPVAEPAPAPVVVAPDVIQVTRDGFSPLAQAPANELVFEIRWGAPASVVEWAVSLAQDGQPAVKTFRGTDTVPTLTWDGRNDGGNLVAQGRYRATLQTAGADGVLADKSVTNPFLVDIVPPSGTISVDPLPFRLGDPNVVVNPASKVTITLDIVSGGSPWTVWRLAVVHPDGRKFRDFISEEHRENQVIWDGRALNNAQLEVGITYRLEAEVFDIYGNRGVLVGGLSALAPLPPPEPEAAPVPVVEIKPIQVSVVLDGQLLASLPVWFAPYTADLDAVEPEMRSANQSSIQQLADLLKAAPGVDVTVVGHANQVLYADPDKAAYEQRETLIPLSIARAEAVRAVLVSMGLSPEHLLIKGVGASEALVPFDDAVNRWKNRRVVIDATTP